MRGFGDGSAVERFGPRPGERRGEERADGSGSGSSCSASAACFGWSGHQKGEVPVKAKRYGAQLSWGMVERATAELQIHRLRRCVDGDDDDELRGIGDSDGKDDKRRHTTTSWR
uniref:Uncharacterized protein n=1 Tax=Oryza sativa subsp. japonica TaxID=39947 RepID=Q6K499_ORYSJ|nr:hypothetical protein [Oryza sativa Japonica Group]